MPDIVIAVSGLDTLIRRLDFQQIVGQPVRTFLLRSALTVEAKAKEIAPVDTGRLRASINSRITSDVQAVVKPDVNYGAHVEFGTHPHWPPINAMAPWARRHGFPEKGGAFLVARAIAQHGTRPHPYMTPAAEQSEAEIQGFAQTMATEIETRWQNG